MLANRQLRALEHSLHGTCCPQFGSHHFLKFRESLLFLDKHGQQRHLTLSRVSGKIINVRRERECMYTSLMSLYGRFICLESVLYNLFSEATRFDVLTLRTLTWNGRNCGGIVTAVVGFKSQETFLLIVRIQFCVCWME